MMSLVDYADLFEHPKRKVCSGVICVELSTFSMFARMIFEGVDALAMKIAIEIQSSGKFAIIEGFTSRNDRGCRRGRKMLRRCSRHLLINCSEIHL